MCQPGYFGEKCQSNAFNTDEYASCPLSCSGHGYCAPCNKLQTIIYLFLSFIRNQKQKNRLLLIPGPFNFLWKNKGRIAI